ncbi:MAG: IS701 family transposase [Alphaproteobacteria bacterium]|nr:IS701 family transposase [Alphaproteobacteria bacterium]
MEALRMTREDATGWARGLDALMERIGGRFGRVEPRRRALAYLRGLLSTTERKNGWQLAEVAGDRTPDGVQDFLSRVHWDADAVRDDLRAYVIEHLGDGQAVLVLDETGFLKKGDKSCGVQRQYSGTAGRIENCQIGVFLGYASRHGQALIDRALYLPERWTGDAPRRAAAGVPQEIAFATKLQLGRVLLARAFAAEVPCTWVVADSVYGADHGLRRFIESQGRGYVMAVTSAQQLALKPVEDWLEDVPARAWRRLSAGDRGTGPRLYYWAYLPYRAPVAPGWQKGLLIRRKIKKPEDFTFYLTLAPAATTLAEQVRVAGMCWTVERCFETAKGEVGLDQYEVRSWTGWHRHITLAMLAHAYLVVLRHAAAGGKTGTGRRDQRRTAARPAAAHRARIAPAAVASSVGAPARSRTRPRLVTVAAAPSAARPPLPLATANAPP